MFIFIDDSILLCLQGEVIPTEKLKAIAKLVEPWFLFALVWSIGATVDGASRKKFDTFLREKIKEHNVTRKLISICSQISEYH